MPDVKLVSPLLDGFVIGDPMSSHDGVCCCPAMKENDKYIVKIISVPASQKQLDALLLTGAYKDAAAATAYFKDLADGIVKEAETLQQLSKLEGFLPYDSWQVVPMDDGKLGYQVYLVSPYKRSLEKFLRNDPMTHLGAVNLGLDLCAALAVCRRAGSLYVDLKPANIYLTGQREFRIGDLGFVDLHSLKYTALPSKYHSPYTAPELHDALATLNPTADTYAVGMILYQIYNNGQLPLRDQAPSDTLPAPLNADYEMAEIIMKAIDPDPRVRWQNPIDMGQALVGYMQRNVINDTPIVPPAAQPLSTEYQESDAPTDETFADVGEAPYSPDAQRPDETIPGADAEDEITNGEMSEEIISILAEADELIAHEAPSILPNSETDPTQPAPSDDDACEEYDESEYDEAEPVGYAPDAEPARKGGWIAAIVVVLVLALLLGGGVYFYKNHYLLEIDEIKPVGNEDTLTVQLVTAVDESMLYVVCTDTYGNTFSQNVSNGQAVFADLNPGTTYKISVAANGFHAMSGAYTGTYTTPEQTNIVSFTAITGAEDGSVVLNFTVDGRDTQDWLVCYNTEGEEEQSLSFTGHMVTVNGLTVGKTYTFTLNAPVSSDLYITGNKTLDFTASRLVTAEDLRIVSCVDGVLTAQWAAPSDISVDSWTVRCYSNDGYDETITVTDASAQFSGISTETAYTVEVTAFGMAQGARAYVTADPTEVSDIQVSDTDDGIRVTWECSDTIPDGGWLLMYSVDGSTHEDVIACGENSGIISPCVPGAVYSITIQAADGSTVFGGRAEHTTQAATDFDSYSLKASDIQASLCLTPDVENWTHEDLSEDSYTTSFTTEQRASMVLYASRKFSASKDEVCVLYVIRNEFGKVVGQLVNTETLVWSSMWSNDRHAHLDIPALPTTAGKYTIELYFDGALVTAKDVTITG